MRKRRLLLLAGGVPLALVAAVVGLRQLARARTVQLFGEIVPRVEMAEARVALTFDDGPALAPWSASVPARSSCCTSGIRVALRRSPPLGHWSTVFRPGAIGSDR
jgi:hypothetical protein